METVKSPLLGPASPGGGGARGAHPPTIHFDIMLGHRRHIYHFWRIFGIWALNLGEIGQTAPPRACQPGGGVKMGIFTPTLQPPLPHVFWVTLCNFEHIRDFLHHFWAYSALRSWSIRGGLVIHLQLIRPHLAFLPQINARIANGARFPLSHLGYGPLVPLRALGTTCARLSPPWVSPTGEAAHRRSSLCPCSMRPMGPHTDG